MTHPLKIQRDYVLLAKRNYSGAATTFVISNSSTLEDQSAIGVSNLNRNFSGSSTKIRVLVIAEHSIFRVGLVTVLQEDPDIEVIGAVENVEYAIDSAQNMAPDVAIVDFLLDTSQGQELRNHIGREKTSNVIVMSHFQTSEDIHKSLMAGAKSILLIDVQPDELMKAVHEVSRGKTYIPPDVASKLAEKLTLNDLTLRERQIAELIATGQSNKQIAGTLHLSEGTVKVHVRNIFSKLHVSSRSQAILEIFRQGIVRFNTSQ